MTDQEKLTFKDYPQGFSSEMHKAGLYGLIGSLVLIGITTLALVFGTLIGVV